jgi:hypothetical protein
MELSWIPWRRTSGLGWRNSSAQSEVGQTTRRTSRVSHPRESWALWLILVLRSFVMYGVELEYAKTSWKVDVPIASCNNSKNVTIQLYSDMPSTASRFAAHEMQCCTSAVSGWSRVEASKAGAQSSDEWSMHNTIPASINPTNSLTAMHVMPYLCI